MSNRRKMKALREKQKKSPTLIREDAVGTRVAVPNADRVVKLEKPAVIRWSQVSKVDREDDETIGTAIVYEDGGTQIIVNEGISDEARSLLYGFENYMHYSLDETPKEE